ncbi:MAG: hemerythrin domain-containing protein [Pseudomonadota bacterium]
MRQAIASETAELSDVLDQHISRQLALCDALEAIADDLPTAADTMKCLQLSKSIYPIIKSAHEFEEQHVFPALKTREPVAVDMHQVMERLHGEHWEDESHGHDLADALKEFAAGSERNAEKLSYMLRSFFGGLRRHLAFEREVLSPMLKEKAK